MPLVLPLMLIFSIILYFELKEYPLFTQERGITLTKCRFRIYKLKTLKNSVATDQIRKKSKNIVLKPDLKYSVPRFAGLLRRTGLDELPQIFNVLKGDMSFIGPRPLMLSDLEVMQNDYPEFYRIRGSLKSKPGISGLWQIFCDREEGVQNLIALDTIYDELQSLKLDFKLMIFTSAVVLTGSNVDAILENNLLPLNSLLGFDSSTRFLIDSSFQPFADNAAHSFESQYSVILPGEWRIKNSALNTSQNKNFKIIRLYNKLSNSA